MAIIIIIIINTADRSRPCARFSLCSPGGGAEPAAAAAAAAAAASESSAVLDWARNSVVMQAPSSVKFASSDDELDAGFGLEEVTSYLLPH